MKAPIFIAAVIASLTLLVSATVWEGVTDVVSTGDLPGNYSVATNSFPKNSVVDITNLENGKVVRALVVSGLETTGLLATLSRNAANSIDVRNNSTCRVRITQPSDDIAFSRFKLGPIAAPEPAAKTVIEPAQPVKEIAAADIISQDAAVQASVQTVTEQAAYPAQTSVQAVAEQAAYPVQASVQTVAEQAAYPAQTSVQTVTEQAAYPVQASVQTVAEQAAYPVTEPVIAAVAQPVTPAIPAAANNPNPPKSGNAGNLGIIPSEERLPEAANRFVIAPEERAPPLRTNNTLSSSSPGTSDFSPFQVPLISRLEQGKCYVQVAAYQRVEHVEDAISRIGTAYPLAVQNIGSDANPTFRILLGPLNQGESGAMLQRFKSIGYNDAFIRYN